MASGTETPIHSSCFLPPSQHPAGISPQDHTHIGHHMAHILLAGSSQSPTHMTLMLIPALSHTPSQLSHGDTHTPS